LGQGKLCDWNSQKTKETKALYSFDYNEGFVFNINWGCSLKNRFGANKEIFCFVDLQINDTADRPINVGIFTKQTL
jgi:hypothetical protein